MSQPIADVPIAWLKALPARYSHAEWGGDERELIGALLLRVYPELVGVLEAAARFVPTGDILQWERREVALRNAFVGLDVAVGRLTGK